jgi:hypothetical protein
MLISRENIIKHVFNQIFLEVRKTRYQIIDHYSLKRGRAKKKRLAE